MTLTFIRAGSDIFELRPHRRAILWRGGEQVEHDYPKSEIRLYADTGFWAWVGEDEARELIGNQKHEANYD